MQTIQLLLEQMNRIFKIIKIYSLNTQNYGISFDKTRIMVSGTRQNQHFDFNLGGHKIDICTDFEYLDVIFSRFRYLHQTKKRKIEQACLHDIVEET